MNITEELKCKYCNEIYKNPITLNCCGDNICKQHVEELLLRENSSNNFACPLCFDKNVNQKLNVNKFMQKMLTSRLQNFQIDSKYREIFENIKKEFQELETNTKETAIYEEINDLKMQVDLDREKLKAEIDKQADDLFQQLESYEKRFKAEYKSKIEYCNGLLDATRKQLDEYEQRLNLFSITNEEKNKTTSECEKIINDLQPNIKELKENFFSNLSIKYKPIENGVKVLIGELIFQDNKIKREFLGKIKRKFPIHDAPVSVLEVLPNGDLIRSFKNTIKILDTNNGKVKKILAGHSGNINDLLVVDENCLISASDDYTIKIWNIKEETVERTLTGHSSHVFKLALTANGDLVSASQDNTIKIWNINKGTEKISLSLRPYGTFSSLVLLNNGDLASGLRVGSIIIWDLDNEIVKKTINAHLNHVIKLELLRNGDLVSYSTNYNYNNDNKIIKIWNINNGTVKRALTGHNSNVRALKELHNGDLVSVSDDMTMKIWNVESGTIKKDLKLDSTITSLTLLPNGDLVTASYESIIIWN